MSTSDRERFFVGMMGSLIAGTVLWWVQSRFRPTQFATSALVNPEAVADIAAQLPQDEDAFIMAAWQLVGKGVEYQPYGSEMLFTDSQVLCDPCLLPQEVLKKGAANCVGQSALLASLLRNRLPPERVYMVVGQLANDGVGGHAWVEVARNGDWYLLESTLPPKGWKPASAAWQYLPQVMFNDLGTAQCAEEKLCVNVASCDCRKSVVEWGGHGSRYAVAPNAA